MKVVFGDNQLRGGGENPILLVRYTTDFDCKEETSFWYIIRDAPFDIESLDKKYKSNVRRALTRCQVKMINPFEYAEQIYEVYEAAHQHYENADNKLTKDVFINTLKHSKEEWWGAFIRETGLMAGWMSCANHRDWTETISAKYDPKLQVYRPSDAIHYTILTHYLNELHQYYVCSGTRNINHKTHVQDYKIRNWKFRRAYCHLHIVINPKIRWLIHIIYPFRRLLHFFDNITLIHQINGLLQMIAIAKNKKTKW